LNPGRLDDSLGQATEQFEAAADRISDRQLVRVMEATRMVTREAAAQMDARVAESRALLYNAAGATLEEFRRQAEVQVDLAISETTERVRSALSALDAENRAACESRRRSLVDDVTRATEQSTEQFRSGIKAFLYSSLVAAVGAVDEHAKITLDGLVRDTAGSPRAIAESSTALPPEEPST
jgi:adenine-specific DNA methylase